MLTVSNILSLLRAPLALLFLSESTFLRVFAVVCAMLTDGLDGFIARRYRSVTQFGAFLDPVMDKFFSLFVSLILLSESKLVGWQVLALLSRDFAVVIFGFYLVFSGRLARYQFQAIWSGKITTCLQFAVLFILTLGLTVYTWVFACFILLGVLALLELSFIQRYTLSDIHNYS